MAQNTWTRKRRQKRKRDEADRHEERHQARKVSALSKGSDQLDREDHEAHIDEGLARSRRVKSVESEATAPSHKGLVVSYGRSAFQVELGDELWQCGTRSTTRTPHEDSTLVAVGDHVRFQESGELCGQITEVLPRRNCLSRSSKLHAEIQQVLVANIDQLLIVASVCEPYLKPGLIDRYLVTAAVNGFDALICFNKIDLVPDEAWRPLEELYVQLGYKCLGTSAVSGAGMDELKEVLARKTTVLSGQSGVGKSSLLNTLNPNLRLKVARVSKYNSKGRHTTTNSRLIRFNFGGHVVDTPGIKELSLWNVNRENLQSGFPEIQQISADCHFRNCSHQHEPNCAVLDALDNDELDPLRYQNYLSILQSL